MVLRVSTSVWVAGNLRERTLATAAICDLQSAAPRGEAGLAMVVQRAASTCEASHTIGGKLRRNVYGARPAKPSIRWNVPGFVVRSSRSQPAEAGAGTVR